MGPQAHPYSPYAGSLSLASRTLLPQQHTYTDLLIKSYENQFLQRYTLQSQMPALHPGLYNPVSLALSAPPPPLGLRSFASLASPLPPPGSFQHLLASMTSSAAKARETNCDISTVTSGLAAPPTNLLDSDRRSTSIAALRMKAREHELRMGLSTKCNNIVY